MEQGEFLGKLREEMGSTPNPRHPYGRRFQAAIFMADNGRASSDARAYRHKYEWRS
jgi:hypothetical protein